MLKKAISALVRALTHSRLTGEEKEIIQDFRFRASFMDDATWQFETSCNLTLGGLGEELMRKNFIHATDPFPLLLQKLPTFRRKNLIRSLFCSSLANEITREQFASVMRYYEIHGIPPASFVGDKLIKRAEDALSW